MNKYKFLDLGKFEFGGEKIDLRGNFTMNLFPRDRLIPPIAQTVIFFGLVRWLLSVMAEACCFKKPMVLAQIGE